MDIGKLTSLTWRKDAFLRKLDSKIIRRRILFKMGKIDYRTRDDDLITETFNELNDEEWSNILEEWDYRYPRTVYFIEYGKEPISDSVLNRFLEAIEDIVQENQDFYIVEILESHGWKKIILLQYLPHRLNFIEGNLKDVRPTAFSMIMLQNDNRFFVARANNSTQVISKIIKPAAGKTGICVSRALLSKNDIIQLSNILFAKNAKIECEGEDISERTYGSRQGADLFSLDEFQVMLRKPHYNIRRVFATLNLDSLPSPEQEVKIRIFPNEGKITFTGFPSETQIINTIEEVNRNRTEQTPPSQTGLWEFVEIN